MRAHALPRDCQDFLTDRSTALCFQGTKSNTMNFENGTPQGSTLSPCFFSYAMNTFLKLKFPAGVKVITYANDIVLYCHNYQKPMKQLQHWRIEGGGSLG